jgi:hypothetical protein
MFNNGVNKMGKTNTEEVPFPLEEGIPLVSLRRNYKTYTRYNFDKMTPNLHSFKFGPEDFDAVTRAAYLWNSENKTKGQLVIRRIDRAVWRCWMRKPKEYGYRIGLTGQRELVEL